MLTDMEQSMLPRHRLNRGNRGNRTIKALPARNQADGAGAMRSEGTRGIAGTVSKRVDGFLYFFAGGIRHVGGND